MNQTQTIEHFLGERITSSNSVSGGCIANSKIIKAESGKSYFLKSLSGKPGMFLKEANGLIELAKPKTIRIPKVLLADSNFLLLENIEQGNKPSDFFNVFGQSFAQMHQYKAKEFGFFEDNYIGASPQYNLPKANEKTDWPEFYFQKRLLPQLKMVEQNGYASSVLSKGILKIGERIHEILKGSEEAPTLLHGDLWGGNYLCDKFGIAVLIDPACYYGHREADLAMTKMFGGFTQEFYDSYQKEFPLAKGWEYRENIYLLYHYLNHLNLFGSSYYSSTVQLINTYI